MKAQILVVEDQKPTANLILDILKEQGYEAHWADSAAKARAALKRALPDLLILDRTLPDGEGLEILKDVRGMEKAAGLPVLILSARKAAEEKVAGLKGGADDYLAKPFNTEELVARVEALLRRSGKKEEPKELSAGELKLDMESRKTYFKGKEVGLTAKEFDLLWCLLSQRNRVLTREFLLQHVWGYDEGLNLTTKVVDVTVSHLREKLGAAADMIAAVRGFGYRLDAK